MIQKQPRIFLTFSMFNSIQMFRLWDLLSTPKKSTHPLLKLNTTYAHNTYNMRVGGHDFVRLFVTFSVPCCFFLFSLVWTNYLFRHMYSTEIIDYYSFSVIVLFSSLSVLLIDSYFIVSLCIIE